MWQQIGGTNKKYEPACPAVQVVSLKKVHPQSEGSSFQAQAAAPQVQPHLTSAAMRSQAQAAQPLPTAKVCPL